MKKPETAAFNALKTMIHILNYFDKADMISDGCCRFISKFGVTYVIFNYTLPDESGAKPDIIYDFMDLPLVFEPSDVAVYDDMLVVTGTS